MVVWQDPNVLILDEPTNHLDLEMRHALAMALQGYTGAIVLVSHDRHLLRHVVESLWLVEGGSVAEYPDDLSTYEKWVLAGTKPQKIDPKDLKTIHPYLPEVLINTRDEFRAIRGCLVVGILLLALIPRRLAALSTSTSRQGSTAK